jgi:riboflavin kinase
MGESQVAEGRHFKGIVRAGVKEGGYYLSLPFYRAALESKLGFMPYPGTLNLELPREWMWARAFIRERGERVEGKGELGGLSLCRGKLGQIPVGLLVPDRTAHENVVEVVAEKNLRQVLGLSDGEEVWVEISGR